MRTNLYHVVSNTSEDRFGETVNLEEAVTLARSTVREGQVGDSVLIEHRGLVIRQLTLTGDGRVVEQEIR